MLKEQVLDTLIDSHLDTDEVKLKIEIATYAKIVKELANRAKAINNYILNNKYNMDYYRCNELKSNLNQLVELKKYYGKYLKKLKYTLVELQNK